MLTPIALPYIAERILGVTIPDSGLMYACSYEGLHKIFLEDPVRVETDEAGMENYDLLKSKGTSLGIFGGVPILKDTRTSVAYEFDLKADVQIVEIKYAGNSETFTFATLSGDWFFASLSKCGRYLLCAEPYAVEVRRID